MKLKKWELAFIMALAVTFVCGAALSRDGRELSGKLVRLHVVGNSDSEEDQQLKLRVRDRVLDTLTPALENVTDSARAKDIIASRLPELERAATDEVRLSGYDYAVTASLRREDFPTREYDTFSLPAGVYDALRVEIGDASGRNWWCVVFPPLCAPESYRSDVSAITLSGEERSLITGDSDAYVVKFKALELLAQFRRFLRL
jgi:stage II sporulation protein R